MTTDVKKIIKQYSDYIENNQWKDIYSIMLLEGVAGEDVGEFTECMLKAGIDPLRYLKNVPGEYLALSHSVKDIVIPSHIKSIGYGAFAFSFLERIIIKEGVKEISESFSGCRSLEEVYLPTSIDKIAKDAFFGCDSLNSINYAGTKEEWAKIDNPRLGIIPITIICKDGDLILE